MDVSGQRHHLFFGETAKGVAHQRVIAVQPVRQPALAFAHCLAERRHGRWRQALVHERRRHADLRGGKTEGRGTRQQALVQMGDRLGAEQPRQGPLEGVLGAGGRGRRREDGTGGLELRAAQGKVVELDLRGVDVPARQPRPRPLEQHRGVGNGLAAAFHDGDSKS